MVCSGVVGERSVVCSGVWCVRGVLWCTRVWCVVCSGVCVRDGGVVGCGV